MVVNTYRIPSMPILSGAKTYPENIIEKLAEKVSTMSLDATKIAADLGNPKSANIVLLGALIKALGMTDIDWKDIIARTVKPNFVEINKQAFDAGFAAI